ncbi:MAG: hypothetical protein ACFFAN_09110 [Promethearchaeota archaeon]
MKRHNKRIPSKESWNRYYKKCELVGLDFLEIDTYLLGRELKKSIRIDQTFEVNDEFLEIIL